MASSAETSKALWLVWDYTYTEENPASNIVFEVWSTPDLGQPLAPFAVVQTNRLQIDLAEQGYFIVRASNTVNSLVSEWNVKTK